MTNKVSDIGYHELNAMLNLFDQDGKIQFEKDREAATQYFLQEINPNTVFFHSLEEKLDYLYTNGYYEREVFEQYPFEFVKGLFKYIYDFKFRFSTFMGAFKFYKQYALTTFDGKRYLERFEDRVVANALLMGEGNEDLAKSIATEIITGRYQPATPTFLNAGKKQRGEYSSCYLMDTLDNMESISRNITNALQLSKRGGGVAINLSNIRESGAPIKNIENQSSGVVPVMKILEDSFSYANQLGARQGAGAVYLHAHHPDILHFLDTKRENADEKTRIKTLSLGVVIPDITFELAKKNEPMYLFSPYSIKKEYGKDFSEIEISKEYYNLVDNPKIRKKKINARALFQTIAELQFESGYPYLMFEDTVNRSNPIEGRVKQSNLCVTGDTRLLTSEGYKRADALHATGEALTVLVDKRARDLDPNSTGLSPEESTAMQLTAKQADVFKVKTSEGYEIRATEWHKMYVKRGDSLEKISLSQVVPGDRIPIQSGAGAFGVTHEPDLAYIAGVVAADGTFPRLRDTDSVRIDLYDRKQVFAEDIRSRIHNVLIGHEDLVNRQATLTPEFRQLDNKKVLACAPLAHLLEEYGVTKDTKTDVPEFVKSGDRETQEQYISGLFGFDGTIVYNASGALSIELGSINRDALVSVQLILLNLGIVTKIYKTRNAGTTEAPNGHGGTGTYKTQELYSLRATTMQDVDLLYPLVEWLPDRKEVYAKAVASRSNRSVYKTKRRHWATVQSIEADGVEDVYDVTVENGHSVIFNGIATGQCSEILQVQTPSTFKENGYYDHVGRDISCNLGSMNIAKALESPNFGESIETDIRALSNVADLLEISSVPTIDRGNSLTHSIGLGQMNLHGFLASNKVNYGSEEALDFWNIYMYTVLFHALTASNKIAQEKGEVFYNFEKSKYADGTYFDFLIDDPQIPKFEFAKKVFADIHIPTKDDWIDLRDNVMAYGLYNQYLQAVPPTGSISYINNATSSIHPVASAVEIRKEGKLGRVYYPAYGLNNENLSYYADAFEVGYEKIIDTYAVSQKYVDQGQSLTLFFRDTATTRDLNKAYIYAWRKGIKTIYYVRLRQKALDGTEVNTVSSVLCESCQL